ncbi:MAG: FAD-dependent oxidoreductase [Kofleriaceae bacterium]
MSPAHIAVLGGGYAGVLAARRLASALGPRGQVTLVSARDHLVERIRLHQVAAGQAVATHPLARLVGAARVQVATVRALDPIARVVDTSAGPLRPDFVVNALGSLAAPVVSGGALAMRLDTPADAASIGARLRTATPSRPLAIIGGGLTAIELAAELALTHPAATVALFCRGQVGGRTLGAAARARVVAALAAAGVVVRAGVVVTSIEPDAVVVDGARQPVAGAVWCGGFAASPLAAAAGLAVVRAGRMLVEPSLLVAGVDWLWGAGDAAVPDRPVGAPVHMACKTALPMAAAVADHLAAVVRGAAPGRFWFGDSGGCVSRGRTDAVIQRRGPLGDDRGVVRGRVGAWIKEAVCRFTIRALRRPAWQASFRLYARRGRRGLAAAPTSPRLPIAP